MFDTLGERLNKALDGVRGSGNLTEDQVKKVTREIRLALLEADVNYSVVKELANLMGGTAHKLSFASRPPTVVMLAGLNGHGKTTAAGKLALFVRKLRKDPYLVACDTYRPAAIEQLQQIGRELSVPVYTEGTGPNPEDIAEHGIREARDGGYDFVIVDTAGRQVVDVEMMEEIRRVRTASKPHSVLLVLDVVTGQNAVEVAQAFQEYADFDGMVLTKLDGDARGGAALSVVSVTGRPIKFASQGKKLMSGKFTFEDFLQQMQMIKKMGPLSGLLGMIPGLGKQLKDVEIDDRQLGRVEAMITSMTLQERRNPK